MKCHLRGSAHRHWRKKFTKTLDRLNENMYSDTDGRMWFKGFNPPTPGRPANYGRRKRS